MLPLSARHLASGHAHTTKPPLTLLPMTVFWGAAPENSSDKLPSP